AEEARAARPELADARFDEASRDVGPLLDAVTEGARRAHVIAEDLATFAPAEPAPMPHGARRAANLGALIDVTLKLASAQLDGIVQRQGGRITVESALGRGTTFRVELPLPVGSRGGESHPVGR